MTGFSPAEYYALCDSLAVAAVCVLGMAAILLLALESGAERSPARARRNRRDGR